MPFGADPNNSNNNSATYLVVVDIIKRQVTNAIGDNIRFKADDLNDDLLNSGIEKIKKSKLNSDLSQKAWNSVHHKKAWSNLRKSINYTLTKLNALRHKGIGAVIGLGKKIPAGALLEYLLVSKEMNAEIESYKLNYPELAGEIDEATSDIRDAMADIGARVFHTFTVGLFEVERTTFDMYDKMPKDDRIIQWLGDMENYSREFNGRYDQAWVDHKAAPPAGFVQYLLFKHDIQKSLGDNSLQWIEHWAASAG